LKAVLPVLCVTLAVSAGQQPTPSKPDPWAPIKFLEGKWTGSAQGEPGVGTVQRSYEFVLGHRFLYERNISRYEPKQGGDSGEVHEHRSMFSFDKRRNRLVLRQFHQEGFVNQYVMDVERSSAERFVFVSEAFENLAPEWRARETYEVVSKDEFIEIFEIAPPGKEFSVYSRSSFKRVADAGPAAGAGGDESRSRAAASPPDQAPFAALSFLIGKWAAEGGGSPGRSVGEFSFAWVADGHALLRRNEAITAAGRHDDALLVYLSPTGEQRALYTDNEGHTIEYAVTSDEARHRVVFESSGAGPRFRLWYEQKGPDSLASGFEIAQPGSTEFKTYLEGVARRK